MTGTIIPLRPKKDGASALAGFDVIAAKMLTEGCAVSLSAARIDAILVNLRAQRTELTALPDDLQARPPSSEIQIGAINTNLIAKVDTVLAWIEFFTQRALQHH